VATGNWAIFGVFPSRDAEKSRSRSFHFKRLQELPLMHLYYEYEVPTSSLWRVIARRLVIGPFSDCFQAVTRKKVGQGHSPSKDSKSYP
jgi:hypothetical protein